MIEALSNTLIVIVVVTFALAGFQRVMRKIIENSYAKIAQVEATHLDEKFRRMTME